MGSLVPKKLTRDGNAAYTGLPGEIVTIPGFGCAVHDGFTPGGTEVRTVDQGPSRNIARNTNFNFVQNGSSWMGNSGDKTYVFDGWFIQHAGSSTSNVARVPSYDSTIKQPTFGRITATSGGLASSFSILSQRYARPALFAGREMVLSFWIKSSSAKRICIEFGLTFADAGTSSRSILVGNPSLTANEWTFVELPFTVPEVTSSDVIDNTQDHAYLYLWLEAGDNYNGRTGGILPISASFDIGNVKLEFGTEATPYEFDYITEQQKVYEYFEKSSRTMFFAPFGLTSFGTSCGLNVNYGFPKWSDTAFQVSLSYTTDSVGTVVTNNDNQFGFTLTGVANSGSSPARLLTYTADAEFNF